MRRFCLIGLAIVFFGLPAPAAFGDTFHLNDGRTVTGDVLASSADDIGVKIRVDEGKYEPVPWTSFSQEDIKKFAQDKNKKMAALAEPFIEVTREEKIKKSEVPPKEVPRLDRPPAHTLLGAMAGSPIGLLALLLIYAANIYAGFEVAVFRAQPVALVCGVSAVLPVIGPVIFLSMPTRAATAELEAVAAEPVEAAPAPVHGGSAVAARVVGPAAPAAATHPPAQVFQRGEFTFNRRFFETKFPGFFGVIRRDADKDVMLAIKSARGEFVASRITRITASELYVDVPRGRASQEVMVPFAEIQEVQLKHKVA